MELKTKAAFADLHRKLSAEELKALEENLLAQGAARDPIVTWRGFIADGHNRYKICTKHGLPFTTLELDGDKYPEASDVEVWIIRNQLGKRNLTAQEFAHNVGLLYNREKADPHSRPQGDSAVDILSTSKSTAAKIAEETGVNEKTVRRAGKKAEALEAMPKPLRASILEGKVPATDKAVHAFSKAEPAVQQAAARDVRVGNAKSLDEALGLKKPKPEPSARTEFDPVKIEAEAKAKPPKGGKPGPDVIAIDGKIDDLFGKLFRALDDRADATSKGPHHRTAAKMMNDLRTVLTKWQRGQAL